MIKSLPDAEGQGEIVLWTKEVYNALRSIVNPVLNLTGKGVKISRSTTGITFEVPPPGPPLLLRNTTAYTIPAGALLHVAATSNSFNPFTSGFDAPIVLDVDIVESADVESHIFAVSKVKLLPGGVGEGVISGECLVRVNYKYGLQTGFKMRPIYPAVYDANIGEAENTYLNGCLEILYISVPPDIATNPHTWAKARFVVPPKGYFAIITDYDTYFADNRWRYYITEIELDYEGTLAGTSGEVYQGYRVRTAPLRSDSAAAYNTLEIPNTAAADSIAFGNGIIRAEMPPGFEIQPVPVGTVVWIEGRDTAGYAHFSFSNVADGECTVDEG